MKRISKIAALLVAAVMVIASVGPVKASAASSYFEPVSKNETTISVLPGQTNHYTIAVKSINYTFMEIYSIIGESNDSSTMKVQNVKLVDETGKDLLESGSYNIQYNNKVYVDFDILADDSLTIGYGTVTFKCFLTTYESEVVQDYFDVLTLSTYTPIELNPIDIIVDDLSYDKDSVIPGNTVSFSYKFKNAGDIKAVNTYVSIDYSSSGMIPDYAVDNVKIGDLKASGVAYKTLSAKVLENTAPGLYSITVNITAKTTKGDPYSASRTLYYTVLKPEEATDNCPVISLSTEDNYKDVSPNSTDSIHVTLTNEGKAVAKDIVVKCVEGMDISSGITPSFTGEGIEVLQLKKDKSTTVEFPVIIAKSYSSEIQKLKFEVSYKDEKGNAMTPVTMVMYIKGNVNMSSGGQAVNEVTIKNVVQTPSNPMAGEKITLTFDLVNNSSDAISGIKVFGTGLSSNGFEPISSEPYQEEGSLAAGAKKNVSMTFKVGEYIAEGLNTLNIGYSYYTSGSELVSGSVGLYVLNVKNEIGTDVGRPKLIISDFSTDKEVLQAGDTFDFTFALKNTHTNKSAKNIKLTLSQSEGIFSPAAGSNIFYIDEIDAGEISEQTITLKTRADATTGDYTLSVLVEYEYDNMTQVDQEKGGVSENNEIKLRATENYRPVIENIYVDSWETIYVGSTVDLSFEFYNMGKSTLGNVYVTVEGDFCLANNSTMSYVGAISGYGQEYVNPQVVPLVAGDAQGIVTIHFEDSNGDEVTLSENFSTWVEDNSSDFGGDFGGEWTDDFGGDFGDYGDYGDYGDFEIEPEKTGKKWVIWAIIGGAVVAAGVATVLIVRAARKKKAKDELDDEDI